MVVKQCIEPERLQAFALGLLSEKDGRDITAHLDTCRLCEDRMTECESASDSLIEQLRLPLETSEFIDDPHLLKGLARLRNVPTEGSLSSIGISAADSGSPPTHLRDYRLIEKLGSGGMGTVYLGMHSKLRRPVAIKVLPDHSLRSPTTVARFQREIRAIGGLTHPAIVQALDAGEVDNTHFLVMEYVEGMDLSRLIAAHGRLPIPDACELIRQAAEGLQYASETGLVHRDIKPSNLMLSPDGQVKILDFGLALLLEVDQPSTETTKPGQLMGTLDYMAPEQGDDSHQVDLRADIYSLGATFYKLLTGQTPLAANEAVTPAQKLRSLLLKPVRPIKELRPDISAEVARIVHRMLERSPADRYASASEIVEALRIPANGADLPQLLRTPDAPVALGTDSHTAEVPPIATPAEDSAEIRETALGTTGNTVIATPPPPSHQPSPSRTLRSSGGRKRSALAVIVLMAICGLAAFKLQLRSDTGDLIIESCDADIDVVIKRNGEVTKELELTRGENRTTVRSGEYEIELAGQHEDLQIRGSKFELLRNGEVKVTILRQPPPHTATETLSDAQFEGRKLDEWMETLKTERSSVELARAVTAVTALAAADRPSDVAGAILSTMQRFEPWTLNPRTDDGKFLRAAIRAYRQLAAPAAIRQLIDTLQEGSSPQRFFVMWILKDHTDTEHRFQRQLQALAPEIIPALITASHDADGRVRFEVFGYLREFSGQSPAFQTRARQVLIEKDPILLPRAVSTMMSSDPDEPALLSALLKLLENPSIFVRDQAIAHFGSLGKRAAPAVPRLIELLSGNEHWLDASTGPATENPPEAETPRLKIIVSLGNIGPAASTAIPALSEHLQSPNARIRQAATDALSRISP